MQYYTLEHAVDTTETGSEYPQVQKMAPGYDYKAKNSVYALSREYLDLPDYEPNLDYFVLAGRAKASDLLSVAVITSGFLVSEKLKNLLQQFQLPKHKFYPAKVKSKKGFLDYYWLHIICNLTEMVDYPKSTFYVYQNFRTALGYVEINSKKELLAKNEELSKMNPGKTLATWSKKIALPFSAISNLDLFEIGTFNADVFISQALKEAIEAEKITGCKILGTDKLLIE